MESAAETLAFGGTPASDFDRDFAEVDACLSRAGLGIPSLNDFMLANAWWNHGGPAGTPTLPHSEHLHYFRKASAVRDAERFGLESCEKWPAIPDQMAITFGSVEDFDLRYLPVEDTFSRWVPPLLDAGTRLVSIRGLVEPSRVTRFELRAQKRRYSNDIAEAAEKGKMDRAEREAREGELKSLEDSYARDEASATLVDTSIIVGVNGVIDDLSKVSPNSVVMNPMANRQPQAWHETMICSGIRANPHLHDLPTTTIAYSGIANLSVVGDRDGALLGFTERDRQPVYISPTAASAGDASPIMLAAAATGAGKSLVLLWLSHPWAMLKRPVVIIDPKTQSDHSAVVEMSGGQVASLDDFVRSDGALDPLRFSPNPDVGVQLAASMLSTVDPWGPYLRRQYETDIANAIRHGVNRGATATGEALNVALHDGIISEEIVRPVFKMAESYPMFRATFGIRPGTKPLSVAEGITLFQVGQSSFQLPPRSENFVLSDAEPMVRTSINAIRMMVRGSMMALTGRGGVLNIDEAWVVEKSSPDELEAIGRLARSQDVLPILYTQTPSGPIRLGLKGYMSRSMIGHISDEDEARAGLDLFGASSPDLLRRVMAPEFTAGSTEQGGLNWESLKALRNPTTGAYARGSVFYHVDLRGRIAPVEILLPPEFLRLASTTPAEVRKRKAAIAAAALNAD